MPPVRGVYKGHAGQSLSVDVLVRPALDDDGAELLQETAAAPPPRPEEEQQQQQQQQYTPFFPRNITLKDEIYSGSRLGRDACRWRLRHVGPERARLKLCGARGLILEAAPHAFGGPKAEAVLTTDNAIRQLNLALQYRNRS